MREIKFRHYFSHTKVMTAGISMQALLMYDDGKGDHWKYATWMQYTGLKDKNGKEIYEGDLCWTYEHGIGNLIRQVVFDGGSFCFRHPYMLTTEIRGWKADFIEVRTNIYETPDLTQANPELLQP